MAGKVICFQNVTCLYGRVGVSDCPVNSVAGRDLQLLSETSKLKKKR